MKDFQKLLETTNVDIIDEADEEKKFAEDMMRSYNRLKEKYQACQDAKRKDLIKERLNEIASTMNAHRSLFNEYYPKDYVAEEVDVEPDTSLDDDLKEWLESIGDDELLKELNSPIDLNVREKLNEGLLNEDTTEFVGVAEEVLDMLGSFVENLYNLEPNVDDTNEALYNEVKQGALTLRRRLRDFVNTYSEQELSDM